MLYFDNSLIIQNKASQTTSQNLNFLMLLIIGTLVNVHRLALQRITECRLVQKMPKSQPNFVALSGHDETSVIF